MKYESLNHRGVYVIPVGDFWHIEPERINILYAPLSGQSLLVERKMAEELEDCASKRADNEFLHQLIDQLATNTNLPIFKLQDNPNHLFQVDILLNYTCNFKCIYCYSAKGRSNQAVKWEYIQTLLDFLFCSKKKQTRPYKIHFSGGGEPLLNFELIKKSIAYIEEVSKGCQYELGIVTNGSLLTSDIASYLKDHNVEIIISFEILKDLQDKERGQYDVVSSNIDMLLQSNIPFGIRTTFTHSSVKRMCEMIMEIHNRYPQIKQMVFDVVLSSDLFKTPLELRKYYQDYLREFYSAKALALSFGINLESIAVETLSMLRERTCEGKIVLTPLGTISACSRISSPLENDYQKFIYGEIKDNTLYMDTEKFRAIVAENNIYTQERCKNCYAKWNCGGGCWLFSCSFDSEFEQVRCDFMREALKVQLFEMLSSNFQKSSKVTLKEYIFSKIDRNEL